MGNPEWLPFIAIIFGTVLSGLIAFLVYVQKQITEMRMEVTKLTTQMSPLWAKVQAKIAADLHQPHERYVEMDKLLEKLEALTLTEDERNRLKVLLLERSRDFHHDITEGQRQKAKLMGQVMDLVLLESKEEQR
jgi:hypothetical protein